MRKMYLRGAARKTVAAVMLCALIFSTTGVSAYAEGDVDAEVEEDVEQTSENQSEEISSEPEESGTSEHQDEDSNLQEESDQETDSKDETLSNDNQQIPENEITEEDLTQENPALDPAMLEASLMVNPELPNLGCGFPGELEEPEESEWSDWKSDDEGHHTRYRTVQGENGETTTETEIEDCDYEDVVVEGRIEKKCKVCGYVKESWNGTPEITNVSPDAGEHNSVFYDPITISADISCEDVTRAISEDEGLSEDELLQTYTDSYDVTLAVRELRTKEDICIDPEVELNGDTLTYTWKIPSDENAKDVYYAIAGIMVENKIHEITANHELNYAVFISDTEEEVKRASFTVNGKNGFTYDADDKSQHWYSNHGDKADELKVKVSAETYGNKVLKIDSVEEIKEYKDGEEKPTFKVTGQPRQYQVEYEEHIWIFTFKGCRNETTYDYEISLPTNDEGFHEYLVKYSADNIKCEKKILTYIDNSAPEITSVTYNGSDKPTGSEGADEGFYRESVKVVLKVKEDNLPNPDKLEGIKLLNESTGADESFTRENGDEFVATASADGTYTISGKELDKACNENQDFNKEKFTIDTKVPEVDVKFDNDNVKNDKYFNASRTATITVKDANFGADDKYETLNINSKIGSPKSGGWETNGDTFTKKITFDEDGIYNLSFSCKDKAANSTDTTSVQEFVIDTKKPEISVTYNNNNVKNEKYFNAARKATVTVNDISFSEPLLKIEKTGDNALPSLGNFSTNDSKNEASMTFENDGKYAFKITCEDLAGNVSDGYSSDEFIIDTTAPTVDITGVENMSANNGVVEPSINATDLNLVDSDISITVTGSNNGEVQLHKVISNVKDGFNFKLSDIAHEKVNDDLYTLEAKVTDRAGNETSKKIQYSVNRFGSVYVLSDATKQMIDGYYVTNPQDVVITEINIDTLNYKEVSITHDGNVKELSEGKGYKTSDVTNNKGWHSISYDVSSGNFKKDGNYSVTVYSEDRATNKQSNQSKDAEVEFLVDSTAPSVVVNGIESDGVYLESEHDFSVNATDTIGLTELTVLLDDQELAKFTGKDLIKNGGTEVITIPGKDDYQQVCIICSDVAGNETKLNYNNVLISEKAVELEAQGNITKKEIDANPVIKYGTNVKVPAAAACVAGVGAIGAGGAFGFRKFRIKK